MPSGAATRNHQLNVRAAALFQLSKGCVGATAGGEHRVDDHDLTVGNILGQLAEIGVRDERLFVAEHADVAHTRRRDHPQHAVHEAEARAQDGNDRDLLAGQRRQLRRAERRLDHLGRQRQIPRRLVGDVHADLRNQLAKIFDAGVLVAHDAQLVGDQRMVDNVYVLSKFHVTHNSFPFCNHLPIFSFSILVRSA